MKCLLCKKEQAIITRITDNGRVQTQNEIEICENPGCSFYIDIRKLKNWTLKYRPKRQTR